jgi:hypothetical protein
LLLPRPESCILAGRTFRAEHVLREGGVGRLVESFRQIRRDRIVRGVKLFPETSIAAQRGTRQDRTAAQNSVTFTYKGNCSIVFAVPNRASTSRADDSAWDEDQE